jgi:hypothetical protein
MPLSNNSSLVTNSLRAFRARSIGPGSLTVLQQIPIRFDQSGDLKLEFNTEYRAKIYGLVKGALFIDAVTSGY